MIRLPEIPGLQPTQINAPQVNPRAAAAPAQQLGTLAESIAGVSQQFHDHAVQLQKIENARVLSEKRQQLAQGYADFQLDLQKDPDPSSRIQKTRDWLANAKGSMDAENLPPAVRDELTGHFDNFASTAVIRQAEDSARLGIQRAKATFQNEIETAFRTQDRASLDQALATAESAGVILPEEKDKFHANFDRETTGTVLDLAISQEPDLVLEDITRPDFFSRNPGLGPDDIPRLQSAARSSMQRKRSEELDLIEAALTDGKLAPTDLEATRYLTPGDLAKIKASMAETRPPSPTAHSKAWDELFALRDSYKNPAVSDADYAAKWNDTRTRVLELLPPAYQGDLKQELSYRSPANRSAKADDLPDAQAKDFATLASQRIKNAYDTGLLGDITDPKSESAKRAFTRWEDARAKVIQFIKRNPEATFDDIRQATTKALGSTLDDSPDDAPLIPAAPAPVSFDTRLNRALGLPEGPGNASTALLPPR